MARRDPRDPETIIKQLEMEVADKERELIHFREELHMANAQLEKFIGQIENELRIASQIQRSLVPTEIPTIPGFDFSSKFVGSTISGGDYFDIFELKDKMQFGILMASSSGHGMATLLMSILLKITSQSVAFKGKEPNEVLNHILNEMQTNIRSKDAARIFYGVIDRRRYNLAFSQAGKILSYLYKAADDKLVRLEQNKPALAKDGKRDFLLDTISLEAKDKLILLSEGFALVQNGKQEVFGEERIHQYLVEHGNRGCHDIRNELLFQVSQFAGTTEYPRDLSVVVMQVKDKVMRLRKG